MILCPPGIDIAAYAGERSGEVSNLVVAVGRLGDPRKDFGTLIKAFRTVSDSSSAPFRLIIAGRGEPRESDVRLVQQLGLQGAVSFASDVPQDELVALLQEAAVFVSSSAEENWGLRFSRPWPPERRS